MNDPNLNYVAEDPDHDSPNDYTNDYSDFDGVPTLTISANNRHAPGLVRDYLGRMDSDKAASPEHRFETEAILRDMEKWQLDNPYDVREAGVTGVDDPVHVHQDPHNKRDEGNEAEAADRNAEALQSESVTSDDVDTESGPGVEKDPYPRAS